MSGNQVLGDCRQSMLSRISNFDMLENDRGAGPQEVRFISTGQPIPPEADDDYPRACTTCILADLARE